MEKRFKEIFILYTQNLCRNNINLCIMRSFYFKILSSIRRTIFIYDYFYKNLNFVPQFLFLFGAHFNSLIFSMLFYCFHQHECIVGVSMYRYFAATCNQVGIASTNGISVGAALVQWGESVNQ